MFTRTRTLGPLLVTVVLMASIVGYLYLAYLAGCAGDTKGGALGDPVRALVLEGYSVGPFLVAVVSTAIAVFSFMRGTVGFRMGVSVGSVFFSAVGLWFAGMQIEWEGVRSCLVRL